MQKQELRPITTAEQSTTAQNIASRGRGSNGEGKKSETGDRLNALVDQFETFYGELEISVSDEYGKQENRLQGVEDSILRLHHALATEQYRRVESLTAVETHLTERYDATSAVCYRQLADLEPDIPDRVSAWHDRLDERQEEMEEERIARQKAIDREREKLKKALADFEAQLEIEKVERLSRETVTMDKVADEVATLQEVFTEEASRREQTLGHVRGENDEIDAMRDKPDAIFKEAMVTRMVRATKDIRQETATRVHAEQMFVASLESYTKSLQSGLRMVNKRVVRDD